MFCYGTESKQVRVKLIDFAHSYIKGNHELFSIGEINVAKYRSGFTGGLAWLSRSLKDAADLVRSQKERQRENERIARLLHQRPLGGNVRVRR